MSVAIPCYEMKNGSELLKRNLDMLTKQVYRDFDVVITDNSDYNNIEKVCGLYPNLNLHYFKNPKRGMAANTNEAIKRATGDLIKILYQDDYLASEYSLKDIVEAFKGQWLVTACEHFNGIGKYNAHYPMYSEDIHTGNNTIGSPSVLTIKNDKPMLFDENLGYLLDCDYYKRMYKKYGEPTILDNINVVIGIHEGQVSSNLTEDFIRKEFEYINEKYTTK